jgi:hypothetical protein
MSCEGRTTLAIMLVALILGAPLIFAASSGANTNYLALVMHVVPPPTPTTSAPPTVTLRPPRTPIATVGPTATPTLPPSSFNGCQADPNPSAAPNYPVRIVTINAAAQCVYLTPRSAFRLPFGLLYFATSTFRG